MLENVESTRLPIAAASNKQAALFALLQAMPLFFDITLREKIHECKASSIPAVPLKVQFRLSLWRPHSVLTALAGEVLALMCILLCHFVYIICVNFVVSGVVQELEGRRVPRMVSGKTLPCFAPFDGGARSSGFVGDRFLVRPVLTRCPRFQ